MVKLVSDDQLRRARFLINCDRSWRLTRHGELLAEGFSEVVTPEPELAVFLDFESEYPPSQNPHAWMVEVVSPEVFVARVRDFDRLRNAPPRTTLEVIQVLACYCFDRSFPTISSTFSAISSTFSPR